MPTRVKLPDGSIAEFPDGMKPEDIQSAIEQHVVASAPNPAASQGLLSSFADSSGISGALHAIAHPIDTLVSIPGAIKAGTQQTIQQLEKTQADHNAGASAKQIGRDMLDAVPVIGSAYEKARQQQDAGNRLGALGTVTGAVSGLAAPEVAPKILPAVGAGLQAVGDAGQEAGIGVMNRTLGALQADFKRGANPSRGYFAAGGGPAASMSGLAEKSAALQDRTGAKLGQMLDTATAQGYKIPAARVQGAIVPPMDEARAVLAGPGGLGGPDPTAPINTYAQTFQNVLGRDLTPREFFNVKDNIAKNTSWGDPTQVGLKEVRQNQVGAMGGVLNENPVYGQQAQNYQDLSNFANRAQLRAATGSQPLTHLAAEGIGAGLGAAVGGPAGAAGGILANSIPVKSTLASGLYYGGKAANSLGGLLVGSGGGPVAVLPSAAAPTLVAIPSKVKRLANGQ